MQYDYLNSPYCLLHTANYHMTKHLAAITIFSDDRHNNALKLQKILTDNGSLIMARLGVNPARMCSVKCPGIIVLVVEGTTKEITELTRKIDKISAIRAKNTIIA
jgi:metal-responsive CopG/Arc/MetJ family transcriptional regulator